MGLKAGLGDVAAQVGQSRGFEKTVEYGGVLASGKDTRNVAINTFCAGLNKTLLDLEAYTDNVATSKSYLDVVKAQAEVVLGELGEMKQLALQAQNASATDRLSLQGSLASKQQVLARKLCTAEFGGVNLFTSSTVSNNFQVGNGLKVSANVDSASAIALTSTAALAVGNAAGGISVNASDTVIDISVRIYGEATLQLAGSSVVAAADGVYLSPGSVAIVDFYGAGQSATAAKSSMVVVGSTNGGAGITAGGSVVFTAVTTITADWYGAQPLSAFGSSITVVNGGVFNYRMTGTSLAANAAAVTAAAGATAVGAIGTMTVGTAAITPGTACTVDTVANATTAANVIEAAMDQIRQMLRKVDSANSALDGISETQTGILEAVGSAVEDLLAADITDCMANIVQGQSLVQYTTAVWSGQRKLSDLALQTFNRAVT